MGFSTLRSIFVVSTAFCLLPHGFAQGTAEDYQRARNFLHGNLGHSIYIADVSAHWIDKTNRFWYHKVSPSGSEFIVVDAEHNTSAPAFDHARLASALASCERQRSTLRSSCFSRGYFRVVVRRRWSAVLACRYHAW